MKRISILAATLLAAAPALSADLLAVYREATLQDAVYAAAKAQYIGAQERLPQARALLLPNVNFGAGTNYNDLEVDYENNVFGSGQRDFYDYNYGVTVVQPIYRKQNALAYEQAKIQVSQAQTQFTVAAQDLMTRVAQAYFDVLLARANLRTIESQKTAVAQQLEQAKRNFVVGTATVTDSREAQARYDLVVAQELGAQNEVEVKNRALELLVGKPVGELAGLTTPVTLNDPQPAQMDAWVEQAYQSSLQIALAQQSLELAAREVERASAGHHPTARCGGLALPELRQLLAPGHRQRHPRPGDRGATKRAALPGRGHQLPGARSGGQPGARPPGPGKRPAQRGAANPAGLPGGDLGAGADQGPATGGGLDPAATGIDQAGPGSGGAEPRWTCSMPSSN